MKHQLLFAAATAAILAAPTLATAQDSGWYLRGNAGYGVHTDTDLKGGLLGSNESEGNAAYSLGFGYEMKNGLRMELDGTSLWSDLGKIDSLPQSSAKLRTTTLMANILYDFESFGRIEPYVGAGAGISKNSFKAVASDFPSAPAGSPGATLIASPACPGPRSGSDSFACFVDESDTNFAWQLIAGLGYQVTDNLTWDTNYRYQDIDVANFDGERVNNVSGASSPFTADLVDAGSHTVMTGIRYRFGGSTPPPAPTPDVSCWDGSMVFNANQCPPEPQPEPDVECWDGSMVFNRAECPAQPVVCSDGSTAPTLEQCPVVVSNVCEEEFRQEIIYYEFDKGQSAETRNTINRILDVGQYCAVQNIRVVGHTDTSGSQAYNLGLSQRRAKDARDELGRQGVDASMITSEGKGETEPFVETGDGVREQLNRRTEVLVTLGTIAGMN
ncbi:OmpA family protein [Litorimonas sp.]|jgi:opacity protein-like surface antigen/outer membrane protein OmpA-like peptidoglycan-associated protein|uniref:OmpA family protein n=1 Tax=Litorimonas sp. TaxID=1892381 RepID=UPI003A858C8B